MDNELCSEAIKLLNQLKHYQGWKLANMEIGPHYIELKAYNNDGVLKHHLVSKTRG